MKFNRLFGLQTILTPDLEREFEDRTCEWINKTFRTAILIISALMWVTCIIYFANGFDDSIMKLAAACQVLMIYGYFTTLFKGAARRAFNRMTFVFPVAYIYGFMTFYVPHLPSDSLVFQSQSWIVWVIMLIYAIERVLPLIAVFTAVVTSLIYFYLRFKIPQFQEAPYIQVVAQVIAANITGFFIVSDHTSNARRQFKLEKELEAERASSDKLLKNVLPVSIVDELKLKSATVAHTYENVTVLFADLVDFTKTAANMDSQTLVKLLDELFSRFDSLADSHKIEKIKTIGDAYMAVAGCPHLDNQHATRMAQFALELDDVVQRFNADFATKFKLKVGLSSGPVIGGVIGKKRISFDLWGDVVNLASRIESVASSGDVLISETTAKLIGGTFELSPSRVVDLKGKGPTLVYSILRKERQASLPGTHVVEPAVAGTQQTADPQKVPAQHVT